MGSQRCPRGCVQRLEGGSRAVEDETVGIGEGRDHGSWVRVLPDDGAGGWIQGSDGSPRRDTVDHGVPSGEVEQAVAKRSRRDTPIAAGRTLSSRGDPLLPDGAAVEVVAIEGVGDAVLVD